jgi:hypothetical protein
LQEVSSAHATFQRVELTVALSLPFATYIFVQIKLFAIAKENKKNCYQSINKTGHQT